jgi:hypothetical protein
MEFIVFPNDAFPDSSAIGSISIGVQIDKAGLDEARSATSDKKHVSLYVSGCANYAFGSDPGKWHQTRFLYSLRKKMGGAIDPDEGDVSPIFLELFPALVQGAFYAD